MVPSTLFLVVPPQRGLLEGFSTGLIAIANFIADHAPDIEVRLLDFGDFSPAEVEEQASHILAKSTGKVFIGITGTTASYQSMLATARAFKRFRPSCVVVLGGHHVSPQDDVVLRHHSSYVDFVIRGEGELSLLRLVRSHPQIEHVPNLSYWRDEAIHRNPEGALLCSAELDRLTPEYQGEGLRAAPGKFDHVTYVSARGCPLKCAFCVVRASKIRAKSVRAIVEDLSYLVGTRGYRRIAIEDNFFAHQPKRTLELCRAIERLRQRYEFDWDCQTRVESMRNAEVVSAMAKAGCTAAYLGVESLVPKHLIYLGKTGTPERYLEALERDVLPLMLREGIGVYLNLQLALPNETSADRTMTIERLTALGRKSAAQGQKVTVFPQLNVIYPGTPHFDQAVARGDFGELGREVFESFTQWETDEEPILRYMGEHFAHGVGGIPIGLLSADRLRHGEFAVAPEMLANVSLLLREMEGLKGVQVFRYGQFLTKPALKRSHA